jgi:hypothetical protein
MYNHVEVSGHNLDESSQTWGFCMDFLNHKGRGMWFSSFLLYRNCKRLREFEKREISSRAVEVTVKYKEEKLITFVWIKGYVIFKWNSHGSAAWEIRMVVSGGGVTPPTSTPSYSRLLLRKVLKGTVSWEIQQTLLTNKQQENLD